jgi:hypothetical protein
LPSFDDFFWRKNKVADEKKLVQSANSSTEFFISLQIRQMKAGQNNKYDILTSNFPFLRKLSRLLDMTSLATG